MSEGTCSHDTPFYLNGEEVLCLRCAHCGAYQVVYDNLHHRDIFWAECTRTDTHVGLPLNKCDNFEEKTADTIIIDADVTLKSFEQIGKMCAEFLSVDDFPHACRHCPYCLVCRDFLGDMSLAELMSEYSSITASLYDNVKIEEVSE